MPGRWACCGRWASDGAAWGGAGWIVEPEEGELVARTSASEPFVTREIDLAAAVPARFDLLSEAHPVPGERLTVRVDVEHRGVTTYTTRFGFTAAGDDTVVRVTSYLNLPPWPWRRVFENRVRPAWQACHERTLEGLKRQVEATP